MSALLVVLIVMLESSFDFKGYVNTIGMAVKSKSKNLLLYVWSEFENSPVYPVISCNKTTTASKSDQ